MSQLDIILLHLHFAREILNQSLFILKASNSQLCVQYFISFLMYLKYDTWTLTATCIASWKKGKENIEPLYLGKEKQLNELIVHPSNFIKYDAYSIFPTPSDVPTAETNSSFSHNFYFFSLSRFLLSYFYWLLIWHGGGVVLCGRRCGM